jgi:HEPN domain-containing protein
MTKAEKEARRWLQQAEEDGKYAKVLFGAEGWYMVCFLSHQVAEKALKAFLYSQGEVGVFGHSVLKLLEKAARYDATWKELRREVKLLEGYYVEARYPNAISQEYIPAEFFEREDADSALATAEKVLKLAKAKLALMAKKKSPESSKRRS